MEYDRDKVGEPVLALLWLGAHERYGRTQSWKTFDWDAMDRLHGKEYISDPRGKAQSVVLTEEDVQRAQELFEKHFGV